MPLTPLDIEHATFERSPMGYKPKAVRAFLERLAAELESVLRELRQLRDRLAEKDEIIAGLREAEAELQRAVVSAERIGTEMKDNAREAARLIEADARAHAEIIKREIAAELAEAHLELARLERSQAIVREQMRGQLTAFLRALDPVEGERSTSAAGDDAWAIGEEDLPG